MKSPDELEGEIEISRAVLAHDLDALKDRAKPERLMHDAASTARERARRMRSQLVDRARQTGSQLAGQTRQKGSQLVGRARTDPVPVVGIGAALGAVLLLLMRRRRSRRPADC